MSLGSKKSRQAYAIVLAIFALSILVRLPQLDRPLSFHHEFNPAMYLVTMDIWDQAGAGSFNFAPAMSFEGPTNKYIENPPIEHGITQRDGDFYYLTFPAMAYVLPYAAFQVLGVKPSPLALQVFNLVIHLLCAWLVVHLTIGALSSEDADGGGRVAAAAAAAGICFLFAPALLWFLGNAYVFDGLVLLFFLTTLAAALPLLKDPDRIRPGALTLLALSVLAGMLTEYVAALLALVLFLVALKKSIRDRRHLWIAGATAAAVLTAVGITVWQYSSLVGLETYFEFIGLRFLGRSQVPDSHGNIGIGIIQLVKWYVFGFLPLLLGLIALAWATRSSRGRRRLSDSERLLLVLCTVPVLIHHLVLFGWTIRHDYSVIKTGIPLSILAGILLFRVPETTARLRLLRVGVPFLVLASSLQFHFINRPGPTSVTGLRYDYMESIGRSIARSADPDEVVFMQGHEAMPQIVYYSGRNILVVDGRADAAAWLRARGLSDGLFVRVADHEVRAIERISAD